MSKRRAVSGGKKILAVASGGGHWVELRRLVPAFDGYEIVYVTTFASYRAEIGAARSYVVTDATRWNPLGLARLAVQLAVILWREKPDLVVSTGAAPGYFCVKFAKWLGARTVWVDSIANADCLSLCGQRIGRSADLWLTQWPHLAEPDGPHYQGAVL